VMRDVVGSHEAPFMTTLCIAQDLVVFWAIYSMFITTTIPFFFGECCLRLRCGFRPTEVIFIKPIPDQVTDYSNTSRIQHYRRLATNSHHSYTSIWSFMTGESWVFVHAAVLDAYNLIDNGEVDEGVLESAIWWQEGGSWSVYQVCETYDLL